MQSKIKNLISGKSGEAYLFVLKNLKYETPQHFIKISYNFYKNSFPNNPSINGRFFEYLICEILAQEDICPFYCQAVFERVPNAEFDIVLYHPNNPVVLTMKTSLRERYKQADLEGIALKQVYRKSAVYLITLAAEETKKVNEKIKRGDISGLDKCLFAKFIKELKFRKFKKVESILPLDGKLFAH